MTIEELSPITDFLKLNGFKEIEPGAYDNERCIVFLIDDYTQIDIKGEYFVYNEGHNIYWIIGFLTYYGFMDKDYKNPSDEPEEEYKQRLKGSWKLSE